MCGLYRFTDLSALPESIEQSSLMYRQVTASEKIKEKEVRVITLGKKKF